MDDLYRLFHIQRKVSLQDSKKYQDDIIASIYNVCDDITSLTCGSYCEENRGIYIILSGEKSIYIDIRMTYEKTDQDIMAYTLSMGRHDNDLKIDILMRNDASVLKFIAMLSDIFDDIVIKKIDFSLQKEITHSVKEMPYE